MKKIYFKLKIKKIDFSSENFDTQIELLDKFTFYIDSNTDFESEVYKRIIKEKGDWIEMDYNESLDISYVSLNLIFHSLLLDENDQKLIQKVLNKVTEFIKTIKKEVQIHNINRLEVYESIINEDGFIISLDEQGGGYRLTNTDLEKFFCENNIEYTCISKRGSWFDGGASGGNGGFIYFIAGAITSGITWDFIRWNIKKIFGGPLDNIIKNEFENLNFEKLRKKIEDRCKVNIGDLILKEMYRDSGDVYIVFESETVRINLITDSNYRVKELIHEYK